MYCSVRRYRMGAGSVDDLMHRVDVDFADAIAQQPGFVAYQAVDCGGGEVMSITERSGRCQLVLMGWS